MPYKTRKQTAIGLIYLLILILIGGGIYFAFFQKTPTCSDKIQNQKEEGVDCGGPCALSCEHLTIKDIEVSETKFLSLKSNQYDFIAQLQNPNPNFGLSRLGYSFKIYDTDNLLIKEQTGITFILPGQTKYLIESNINVEKPINRIELVLDKVSSDAWQKIKDIQSPNIFIKEKQFKFLENQPAVAQASGIVKNDSVFNFENILVSIVLFDGDRNIVAVNKTQTQTVLAGEERYFSASWFSPIAGEVKSVEMKAETNLLDEDNFLRQSGEKEKFQEY